MYIMAEQEKESRQLGAALSATMTVSNMAAILPGNDHLSSSQATTFVAANSVMESRTRTETTLTAASAATVCSTTSNLSASLLTGNLPGAVEKNTKADLAASPTTTPSTSFASEPSISAGSSFTSTTSSVYSAPPGPKSILKNAGSRLEENRESDGEEDDDGLSKTTDASSLDDFDDCDEEDEDEDESEDEDEDHEADDDYCDESQDDADEDALNDSFSFISFGNTVRFAETTVIITTTHDIESTPDNNMTIHERMLLAQAAKPPNRLPSLNGKEYDPEEHPRDVVDLDKDLLAAYINGLRTVDIEGFKTVLRSRTLHVDCDRQTVSNDAETQMNEYLDRILESLLGFFPNLFTEDEYSHILDQAELAITFDDTYQFSYQPESVNVQQMLQKVLEEKLTTDDTVLVEEVLGWLAGELLEPLGRRASFRKEAST